MRATVSEGIGTGLLVAAVVGSGIMGERLAGGNMALVLLANSVATGAVLVTLIFTFGPISGAHFNPAVSIAAAAEGGFAWRRVPGYIVAQVVGAIGGVVAAHLMFELPPVMLSKHSRVGFAQLFSEFLATFGLLVVVHGTGKRAGVVPLTVAAYITAAYWFTSSTSFANPAVTIARGLTDTFSGIAPAGIPGFIVAQLLGALAATLLFRWIGRESITE
ncbi:MAG TPA: MIP/aquaporin family protein [Thermoanaerobaculia bacterium]|nr:MIP/aquaporin family protein [Thermoanaerobaculia bacterium]